MKIRHIRGGDAREVYIRGGLYGLRARAGMSSHWIVTPGAGNVQDWEEVWVPSRWLNDEFQEMKGDARNRDSLCARGGGIE